MWQELAGSQHVASGLRCYEFWSLEHFGASFFFFKKSGRGGCSSNLLTGHLFGSCFLHKNLMFFSVIFWRFFRLRVGWWLLHWSKHCSSAWYISDPGLMGWYNGGFSQRFSHGCALRGTRQSRRTEELRGDRVGKPQGVVKTFQHRYTVYINHLASKKQFTFSFGIL